MRLDVGDQRLGIAVLDANVWSDGDQGKIDVAANTMMSPENMKRDLTMGTAQEVIDQIKRYEDLGYDEYSFWIDSGMSHERKRTSLARFIDDVIPAFQ